MLKKTTITALSAILLGGCGGAKTPPQQHQPRPVKLFTVESLGNVNRDFAGMAVAEQTSDLAFRVSGQITQLNIDEGQSVTKGFLIAELDPRDFKYKLEAARSAMITAKAKLDRTNRLLARQAVSRQDFEIAQTQYAEAKASFENAEGALNDTKLKAPFSGNIEKQYLFNYQRADAGSPVVKLVDPQTLKVRFTMPESGIPLLSMPGKSFTVMFDNYPSVTFAAMLKEYVASSSNATGIPVTLMVDDKRANNGKYLIAPGMSCSVNLRIDNGSTAEVMAIPLNALYTPAGGGKSVWVLSKQNTVSLRSVETGGLIGSDMVEIKSGLTAGEQVVSAGVYSLTDGEQVKVLK